jgi:exodeoxyribonuclease-5
MASRNSAERLHEAFPFEPTAGQTRLLDALGRFLDTDKERCVLVIRGYAGTGKTTSMGALVKVLREIKRPVELLAPTGRAAQVLSGYARQYASTIHRRIYQRKVTAGGGAVATIAPYNKKRPVFIVDEASMIGRDAGVRGPGSKMTNRDLLRDLIDYCFQTPGARLILVGDDAQLPPVGADYSPALDAQRLTDEFGLLVGRCTLSEVVRQALESGILHNATTLRGLLAAPVVPNAAPAPMAIPQLETARFPDLMRLSSNASDAFEDTLGSLYSQYGEDDVLVITRSNKSANQYNSQIRSRIFDREEEVEVGDRLMVVKNNYTWIRKNDQIPTDLIANGDTVRVERIVKRFERYGMRYAVAEVCMVDWPEAASFEVYLMLDALNVDGPNLPWSRLEELRSNISADYNNKGSIRKIRQLVNEDPCWQALQVKFAYAVTAHKSQGGQWQATVIDQGYLTEERMNREWIRWMYTALTRAQSRTYLMNFAQQFFGNEPVEN